MSKKILFNLSACQPIGKSKFHGGGKYGYVVLKKLLEVAPEQVAVYYNDKSYIDEDVLSLINNMGISKYVSSEISLFDAARKESNVIYSPLYNYNVNGIPPSDIVLIKTQHGIRQLEMPTDSTEWRYIPDFKGLLKFIKYRLRNSRSMQIQRLSKLISRNNIHYITVSEHSKYMMGAFLPQLHPDNLSVFYSPSTINDNIDTSDYKNTYGKYYLLLGVNRWIKNNIRAIQAFDQLFTERPEFEGVVVMTGIKKWSEIHVHVKNKDRFILLGYVDEYTLKALYRNAYLFVYPSLNEGFGYPPLEAMHEKCPVVGSAIASIPEICGDSVVYFNPYSIEEIKARVLQMEDTLFRSSVVQRGIDREKDIRKKQDRDLVSLCSYLLSFNK